MTKELTPEERARRERWARVHVEADRRPLLTNLFPRLGSYFGEGLRRDKGAGR